MTRFTKMHYLGLLLLLFINGCSLTPPPSLQAVSVSSAANAYAWQLNGNILVRTAEDKVSTQLYWLEQPQRTDIQLISPIGTSLMALTLAPNKASLTADGNTYEGTDGQQLLQQLTGWSLPLAQFPHWLIGQLTPDMQIISTDAQGRVTQAHTQGSQPWTVEYRQWQQLGGAEVPRLIQLKNGEIQVKIQINRWQPLAPVAGL
ncbi:lipoprotein insertase outer membrane protein LolB [Shewanella sp. NIFS-20-20]|uniref:lipoprotein insertase outer membrane protein LolB n=1 Tax=Shewanella sp. NIFS-20-20 TaxID=2853806 RepID=UPI001C45DC6A|nr:lipoprotein insertase outer membrane protein LolB [Shewanella sp. NIFS-20-20]MBV7315897.1 lipoprotein insertase outer membrane protein LolB [Shewanella sp. NIFS-20-20]